MRAITDGRSGKSVLGLAALAILIVAALTPFVPHMIDRLPGCGFQRLTGLHCPGCGSTRAFGHLLRGEFGAAVGRNPLVVLGLPLFAVAWLWRSRRAKATGLQPVDIPRRAIFAVAVVVVLFWFLRNVPVYPFTLLAP